MAKATFFVDNWNDSGQKDDVMYMKIKLGPIFQIWKAINIITCNGIIIANQNV